MGLSESYINFFGDKEGLFLDLFYLIDFFFSFVYLIIRQSLLQRLDDTFTNYICLIYRIIDKYLEMLRHFITAYLSSITYELIFKPAD